MIHIDRYFHTHQVLLCRLLQLGMFLYSVGTALFELDRVANSESQSVGTTAL